MGDVDFANDFADELLKTLNELIIVSQDTAKDCEQRKHRLDLALTNMNKYIRDDAEEEVVELASESVGASLNEDYNTVTQQCSDYFEGVSSDLNTITTEYVATVVKKVTSAKNILLLKNKDAYSNLKIQIFNVLDTATDV